MCKLISASDAAALIPSNATIATGGFIGIGFAEKIAKAIEARYLASAEPNNLSLVYAAGQGDAQQRGLNHFAHEGMVKRVVGGHWGLAPKLGEMALNNKIEAYNLPQGVICHLFRDIAAGKPATITHVGLNTFVDPRQSGGKINQLTKEDLVEVIEIQQQEYLAYKAFPINIAILRGTTADKHGNITMEQEALPLESLAIAQAAHNSGGIVIVQVSRLTDQHLLTPDRVRIPGVLVDHVVLADSVDHPQTFSEQYNPLYTGEIRSPQSETDQPLLPLDARKVIARRALMALQKDAVVNLGIGMPELVSAVAAEERRSNEFTLTVEPGGIGGQPASGLSFGAVASADAIIDQPAQFDFYDGGGLDQAFLGLAEVSATGDVNVSRFGSKLAGAGGFINITQNTKDVYFLGTFTSGVQDVEISENKVVVRRNGAVSKFKQAVEEITFNGGYALSKEQKVTFITERAVFRLTEDGLLLTEIAPGIDMLADVLRCMDFKPQVADHVELMDPRIFNEGRMNLQHEGSMPISHKRELWKRAMAKMDETPLAS